MVGVREGVLLNASGAHGAASNRAIAPILLYSASTYCMFLGVDRVLLQSSGAEIMKRLCIP